MTCARRCRHCGVTVVQTDEFFIDTGLDPDTIRRELTQAEG